MANSPSTTPQEAAGASAPVSFIPLCVPEIRGNEWTYVKECLDTGWVSSVGAYVDRFEKMFAERVETRFAVATANGTSALHTALIVAGVQPDDEVLVSAMTFIAPANAIRYAGAWPVFVDADRDYWQMDVAKVAEFLENGCLWQDGRLTNRQTGRRVKAIVPVHILGHPVDLEPLLALARKYALVVIEDATESLGASYRGRAVGQFGDLACFSFNGNKMLTTGGGGMLVTNREDLARRAKHLTTQAKADPIEYIHDAIGYNYRLTNMQAAMGCAQLEQLNEYVTIKRGLATAYAEGLREVPGLTVMKEASWASSAFWMYTVLVDPATYGSTSRQLLSKLEARKIQTRPLWQPLQDSPAHAGSQVVGGEVAQALFENALSLPCSVGLKAEDQQRVIAAIREFAQR